MRAVAVLAIRGSTGAKTRLSPIFSETGRAEIAWAMLAHVLDVLDASHVVDHVLVVTREPEETRRHIGARPDLTILAQPVEHSGLNAAFDIGREWVLEQEYDIMLVLHPDLPLLEIADLQCMVRPDAPVVIATDRHAQGTNGLLLRMRAPATHQFAFAFGPDSHDLHITEADRLQLEHEIVQTHGLSRDIDWPQDWHDLPADVRGRLSTTPPTIAENVNAHLHR